MELKKQLDDLAKPPGTYAVFLGAHADGSVDISSAGRKMHVSASPSLDVTRLSPGQEVKLNEAMTVVGAGEYERTGELVTVKEMLGGDRVLVVGRADEERVVRLAGSVMDVPLRVGDSLTVDTRSGFVFEVVPKSEVEELVLEEVPDIEYEDIGGLGPQIEAIRDAVELPFAHPDLFREHGLRPPKGVLLYGPPGTGKTHVGSHVIAKLVGAGWRVGVVAQSHAAVENMLSAVVDKAGVPAELVAKKQRAKGTEQGGGMPWRELSSTQLADCAANSTEGCVVGGTAWDFAHERWPDGGLDLLVIDEAGQFSLADTIAVGRAAQRLLLLGDPQQLPQVSQGRHPEPVDESALAWLAAASSVLPDGLGYLLPESWRMHPAVCSA
ncbi:AAA domain-containing protein, partial [Streptomyces griseoincarnatus]